MRSIIIITVVFLFAAKTYAQQYNLPLPFKDSGACPFEGCSYGKWIANESTILHKSMSINATSAYTVKRGERITALTGVVVTSRPGKARIISSITLGKKMAKAGDVVQVLRYVGEGSYKVWYQGGVTEAADGIDIKILSKPFTTWWVKMKNRKGLIGWTLQTENFDGKDSLY